MTPVDDSNERYAVIANCEDELAIWPSAGPPPGHWRVLALGRSRAECIGWLRQLDEEKRPHELRRILESKTMRP
jgi:uncharacterized protein YbdZ (MbtH family)